MVEFQFEEGKSSPHIKAALPFWGFNEREEDCH
jgi:hypothetical protein